MAHLWEVDHPYYCNQGNYFKNGCGAEYKTWAEFLASDGGSDFDLNLVFRFDWYEGEDHDLPTFNGDPYYRNGELLIFWMGQRHGIFRYTKIQVCRADEPEVLKFLQPRWEHLKVLWAGVSDLHLAQQ